MFIFHGQPLSPDVAFTDPETGVSYPANWLRLATPDEREAIGITEVPDPVPYDQRFYWAPGLPKDHAELVELWVLQTRHTANTLLSPSDWLVVREIDNGTTVPEAWRLWRENIRAATSTKCDAIRATTDTDELAAYITGADYPAWPADPSQPEPTPEP